MYTCILVATDESQLSRKAEQAAIGLAAAVGAHVVALHVLPDYPMSLFNGVSMDAHEVARIEAQWHDKGQAMVDAVVERAALQGVAAKGVLVHSDRVAESLIAAARKHHCDLIVMASHGRRGFGRVLLGSETQHVLTHSTTPVLVLR
jgi:nucleotide-binding universal stress UspA family protein